MAQSGSRRTNVKELSEGENRRRLVAKVPDMADKRRNNRAASSTAEDCLSGSKVEVHRSTLTLTVTRQRQLRRRLRIRSRQDSLRQGSVEEKMSFKTAHPDMRIPVQKAPQATQMPVRQSLNADSGSRL